MKALQLATWHNDHDEFMNYVRLVEEKDTPIFLRDLMTVESDRKPIPIEEVESEEEPYAPFLHGGDVVWRDKHRGA